MSLLISQGQNQDSVRIQQDSTIDMLPNVQIRKIEIEGNRKTKEKIITRELSVSPGDRLSLTRLRDTLRIDRNKIYNTNLFNTVIPTVVPVDDSTVDVRISLDERWYTYPVPIFKLADRNFNDWWVNQNGNLNRVNYGIRFTQYNFRGRGERLRFLAQSGFEDRFVFNYLIPYIDKKQRFGLMPEIIWLDNNNVSYRTVDHVRLFLETENLQRRLKSLSTTLSYRKAFFNFHFLTLGVQSTTISDSVAVLNPEYFGGDRQTQRFWRLIYTYAYDKRDNRNYALRGANATLSIEKQGLGIYDHVDIWTFYGLGAKYWDLGNDWYFGSSLSAMYSNTVAPYFNYWGLGFDRNINVRGFEVDLIEGRSFVMSKNSLRKKLFGKTWDISRYMPVRQFDDLPFAVYGKVFLDGAYVENYANYRNNDRLTDKPIYGLGLGLDIITTYDFVIRLEYSYNSDGNTPFFLNFRTDL